MIIGRGRFNIYLLLLIGALLGGGCRMFRGGEEKEASTLRVHAEVTLDSTAFSSTVPIYREKPVMVTVDKTPFLTEVDVAEAKVVDVVGGFDLQIQLDRRGTWQLEAFTTANPGKHIAIFSQFGKKGGESRWLGAPTIARRISNGLLTFTPDASREEAERIVRGLSYVARENRKKSQWQMK